MAQRLSVRQPQLVRLPVTSSVEVYSTILPQAQRHFQRSARSPGRFSALSTTVRSPKHCPSRS
ncbi:MAG: hypothetical protein ACI4ML_04955 [Aristaeellaceae bacterium]